jgi:hypothetical protein
LTINAAIRDREGAARIRSARYAAHAVSLIGGAMVRRAYRQRSLVEVLLPDSDKLWDSTLRQIDTLLDVLKGRLVVRALGGIFTFDLVHAVSKWDARRAIAGTKDEPKSTPAAGSPPPAHFASWTGPLS